MAVDRPPCSVVLEGGVTSAVIYASLLAHLSESYTFRQLGGASSGAVAAAAAAAAEFARSQAGAPATTAFDGLRDFPTELTKTAGRGGPTTLLRLFQPKPNGLASFKVALASLDRSGSDTLLRTAARVLANLVVHFWPASLFLAAALGGLGWIAASLLRVELPCSVDSLRLLGCATLSVGAGLSIVVAVTVALLLWALWRTVRALRDNHWGLCNGMDQPGFDRPALTPTLHGLFQSLAGVSKGPLLTFGDLWWGPRVAGKRDETGERRIDLQVITTAVNLERPVRLPGAPGANPLREFFYDPCEWNKLFPDDIVKHLQAHARPARLVHDDGRILWALPDPAEWPVLLVARFSLSFPLLLSALPMYVAVPRREMLRAGDAAAQRHFEARKVYFSDGGITSNCPVHLFDAPLPRFPTFGVNLYQLPPGTRHPPVRSDRRDPELEASSIRDAGRWTTPVSLLVAIVSTALNWRDSLQRTLPGFRERVVHLGLPPEVGGLHLAMKPATILQLAAAGIKAADRLRDDFATAPHSAGRTSAWERHRWTRARTSLSALHAYLSSFVDRLDAGAPAYDRLLRTATPIDHPFDDEGARRQALELLDGTRALMQTLVATQPPDSMDLNTPQPRPELHMSPPW